MKKSSRNNNFCIQKRGVLKEMIVNITIIIMMMMMMNVFGVLRVYTLVVSDGWLSPDG